MSRAFAHVSILGVGYFEILSLPRDQVFAYYTPGTAPGHLTSLSGFGLARNNYMDFKAIQDDHFCKIFYNFGHFLNMDHAFSVLQ